MKVALGGGRQVVRVVIDVTSTGEHFELEGGRKVVEPLFAELSDDARAGSNDR